MEPEREETVDETVDKTGSPRLAEKSYCECNLGSIRKKNIRQNSLGMLLSNVKVCVFKPCLTGVVETNACEGPLSIVGAT